MIKMIVSDIDGTLLFPDETEISKKARKIVRELDKKGILFVAASGRNYIDLRNLWKEAADYMAFIASDGAFTIYQGKIVGKYSLDRGQANSFLKDVSNQTDAEIAVYTDYITYIPPKTEEFFKMMRDNTRGHLLTTTSMETIQQDFLKIGIYKKGTIQQELEEIASYWDKRFHRVYTSKDWIEYTSAGVHKAIGVEKLSKVFHISKEEILAIGDNENDREMLSQAGISYAMNHAPYSVKEICMYQTENALETIENLLL